MDDDFLNLVAHELRTPLASVLGFAEILATSWERRDDEERRRLVERIWANAQEANDLVARLVDYTRLKARRVTVRAQPVVLAEVVEHCTRSLTGVLGEHPLHVEVPAGLRVDADPDALDHVLTNLLDNAAKFSDGASPIHVRAEAGPEGIVVAVVDEGPGVEPAERERIFDDFYRAPAAAAARGAGVGLAVARGYVELLGGRIWVESEPGAGSTFAFTLPAPGENAT